MNKDLRFWLGGVCAGVALSIFIVASLYNVSVLRAHLNARASHTMQPDCRDANVPYTMQRDPAHEAPREYPEPPR